MSGYPVSRDACAERVFSFCLGDARSTGTGAGVERLEP